MINSEFFKFIFLNFLQYIYIFYTNTKPHLNKEFVKNFFNKGYKSNISNNQNIIFYFLNKV